MRSRERQAAGFTLIEVMIVVVIVAVLAAVAIVAYNKYIKKAHSSEVPLIFGEFSAKEEQYQVENSFYLSTPGWYPAALTVDTAQDAGDSALWPAEWNQLRIRLPRTALYCQYQATAGVGGTDPAPPGAFGAIYGGVTPPSNWYYLMAQCDWSYAAGVSEYFQRGDDTQLHKDNEGL